MTVADNENGRERHIAEKREASSDLRRSVGAADERLEAKTRASTGHRRVRDDRAYDHVARALLRVRLEGHLEGKGRANGPLVDARTDRRCGHGLSACTLHGASEGSVEKVRDDNRCARAVTRLVALDFVALGRPALGVREEEGEREETEAP